MRRGTLVSASLTVLTLVWGCSPGSSGGTNNSNGNDNSGGSFELSVEVDLSTNGAFDLGPGIAIDRQFRLSISDVLGMSTLDAFAVALDPQDVDLTPANTSGVSTNGLATLDVFVGAANAEDVCSTGLSLGRFEISVGSNGEESVSPLELTGGVTVLGLVGAGEFEMCIRAAADTGQTLTLDRLLLLLDTTAPNLNCSEIFALSQVQSALDLLADEGFSLDLQRGSSPRDITGTYTVTLTVEFDPDGTNEGQTQERTDAFSNLADGSISRATGRVEIEPFITGTDSGISLCILARTNNPDCDQTIARVESYDVDSNGFVLDGSFLAVVTERHPSDDPDCGESGDFIFGSITLTREGAVVTPPANDNLNGNLNENINDNLSDTTSFEDQQPKVTIRRRPAGRVKESAP